MIKYTLKCKAEHLFEAWFDRGSDFDDQAKRGLVECPSCGSKKVEKAPMAPNIKRSKNSGQISELSEIANKIRQDIERNCDDVGDGFADEARAIHYGEKPERGIYGQATPKQAKDLLEEGVKVSPLPEMIAPKPKKKLN